MSLKNSKRKEIIKSVMSLGLCGVLLAGGTLAYFTKTLTSTENSIRTQSMNMEVTGDIYSNGKIFDGDVVVEGQPITKEITVKNTGELGFGYQLKMTGDIDPENEELAKVMRVYLHNEETSYDESNFKGTLYKVLTDNIVFDGAIESGEVTKYITVVLPQNNSGYDADIYSGKTLGDIDMTVTATSPSQFK